MLTHHPEMFGDHRHYDKGHIMPLVVEGQDSTRSCLNPPLLFISKAHETLCLHTQNFTVTRTLKKVFSSVSREVIK